MPEGFGVLRCRLGRLREFASYGFSSGVGLLVDVGLLVLLTERVGLSYFAAGLLSFSAGIVVVYTFSVAWVFEHRRIANRRIEFFSFAVIGLLGLAINQLMLWGLVEHSSLSYQLAKAPTAAVVFLFNFMARRALLFSPGPK